ncbi:MAG: metal-dependent hydrolase [Proteobacteria bacterium]|nr:metal-dependent hydrolase [Pseudomonadota bacterium]
MLSAALLTEPIRPPEVPPGTRYARWRERFAVLLGATIMDADGVLGWISQTVRGDMLWYAKYHRVVTHSVVGLALCALLAAWNARSWPERWLLPTLRPQGTEPAHRPSLRRLFGFAGSAAGMHFLGDAITHWGTLKPLWPVSQMDVQWNLVNSLSWPIFTLTLLAWAVQNQVLRSDAPRRWGWIVAALWLLLCGLFMAFRPHLMSAPPFT